MKIGMLKAALPAILLLSSCGKGNGSPDSPGQLEPGYAKGRVVDTNGQPLAGVKIYVDNSIFYNSGINTVTDANGFYRVATPQGSWRVFAEMLKTYNGIVYKIDLHPDQATSFAGVDGVIRNFSWKLTGEKAYEPGSYYGGLVKLYKDPNSDMYDMQNIEFTFTPFGPLIDGSAGQTLVRKCGQPQTDFYGLIHDIPIGKYRVTAKYLPTGQSLKLRNDYVQGEAYTDSPLMEFFGKSSGANCTDCMYLAYSDQ